jgi:phosphoribosylformylglycinamidine synthase
VQGTNVEELDFQAVQRGDAEMEQKVNRVIRTCVELGERNPIVSIHDQGAGGNGNVLKEIVEPEGAVIEVRKILLGDQTLSVLEIWGAEYQESDALLIQSEDAELFSNICIREDCPYAYVGVVTGDGHVILHDSEDDSVPLDLELETVLGKMPRKTFKSNRAVVQTVPFTLPPALGASEVSTVVSECLQRVLRLLSVGSKRFLTTKVDRSVTGLIAQQQCVGPLHIPLANCGVVAQSYFGLTGGVTAIGEQPIKGLLDPKAMARLTLAEMLTNIVWAKIDGGLESIKCSGNWMWAAKLEHEGAAIYDAVVALRDAMIQLKVAIDGGKDSLSMAALVDGEMVKAPGTLVVSGYSTVGDITKKVTPDIKYHFLDKKNKDNDNKKDFEEERQLIKENENSYLIVIDLGMGKNRLGGSALAQVFGQVGQTVPDLDDVELLKVVWNTIQRLVDEELIVAGHDRSDGGLVVTLMEMAFTGNCGLHLEIPPEAFRRISEAKLSVEEVVGCLFSEEVGMVIEVLASRLAQVRIILEEAQVPHYVIGRPTTEKRIRVKCLDEMIIDEDMTKLRDIWEETSFELDKRQANPKCVESEKQTLASRTGPTYKLTFVPEPIPPQLRKSKVRVGVIREEGSNGDREMAAAFLSVGFEVWDIKMSDIVKGDVHLNDFRGIAFVGGFSYADVLDSAKGWSAKIHFHEQVFKQFQAFFDREDTFSLGLCNGCQLLALLGVVPSGTLRHTSAVTRRASSTDSTGPEEEEKEEEQELDWFKDQPRFIHNESARFESRFVTVRIEPSPAIMLQGMEGSTLGVWSSHGEGRVHFPNQQVLEEVVLPQHLAPIRYVDDEGEPTEVYPFNPNGSIHGIAALCSANGRHLAIMPHPERTFMLWQWPWLPLEWTQKGSSAKVEASPWLRMFQNARAWCERTLHASNSSA